METIAHNANPSITELYLMETISKDNCIDSKKGYFTGNVHGQLE